MAAIILLIIFGTVFGTIFGINLLKHRHKMAELEVRKLEALAAVRNQALPAADQQTLSRELLEAYAEVERTLARKTED